MKTVVFIFFLFFINSFIGQEKTTIYCFPGQGSDERIFDSLVKDSNYVLKIITYSAPDENMDMKEFAKELSKQIDTTKEFVLFGVSLGGMICVELSEFLKPQKTIIIASVKNRKEFPKRYSFQKYLPIYKLVPGSLLLLGAKICQPIVEPDRNKSKAVFKSMLSRKDANYMKRTVSLVMNWERTSNTKSIYQIHGDNDHTLPLKNIKNPMFIVENGSHMMTLTNAKSVSCILNYILVR